MVGDFISAGQELGCLLTKSAYKSISGKKQRKNIRWRMFLDLQCSFFKSPIKCVTA